MSSIWEDKNLNNRTMTQEKKEIYMCVACDRVIASLRCSQCKEFWYCSKICQLAHWKDGHKLECKKIFDEKKLAETVPQEDINALVKEESDRIKQDAFSNHKKDDSIPVKDQFTNSFPCGELVAFQDFRRVRYTNEEARERERSEEFQSTLKDAREAAEVHRQARYWLQNEAKPGRKIYDLAEGVENKVRFLIGQEFPLGGVAFPTGCSFNEVAAHYSPNPGDNKIIGKNDVVKFDIGVHRNGRIIDSAFTMCWNEKFEPLLKAVQEATDAGVKTAGLDVRLYDIGVAVEEVMESHEVELDGVTYPVKCIENLNGHGIGLYRIHHKKSVPTVRREYDMNVRMEEMEFFAIETFGSIRGEGYVDETRDWSHFMINYHKEDLFPRNKVAKRFYNEVIQHFNTLCWCPRHMERIGIKGYDKALDYLIRDDIINPCPPLTDLPGSYTAQFEHTLCIRPTCKEVLSRGDDY